jgi:hypothetical protein
MLNGKQNPFRLVFVAGSEKAEREQEGNGSPDEERRNTGILRRELRSSE